jgi:hypothetical protein
LVNPFGILYNPESIHTSISRILAKQTFMESEIFEHEGGWKSFYHHSRFAYSSSDLFLKNANEKLEEASDFLYTTDFLIITFGTAWVYRLKESGKTVSNCHKLPASLFVREKLTPEAIVSMYTELLRKLFEVRPEMQVIFTVSPIRHWKDGAHENQLSKATLLLAIEQLQQLFPSSVIYFPAYEIVLDELRDYRFYTEDMIHPNEIAVNYIWERFSDCFFSEETTKRIAEIQKLVLATQHRPFQPESEAFRRFVDKNLVLLEETKRKYPNLDFGAEREYFERFR